MPSEERPPGQAPPATHQSAPSRLDMTRRRFLRNSTVTAGVTAAGLAGVLPSVLPAAEDDGGVTSAAAGDGSGLAAAPVTAHVTDLSSGEMSLFVEDRTVVVRDPALASRIAQAARG